MSELIDPVTGEERRFRDQPNYVYNVGLIQSIPIVGLVVRRQLPEARRLARLRLRRKIQTLRYEGNLEAFWETRLSKSTVLRFTGANLLDAEKLRERRAYERRSSPATRTSHEVEREKSGRLFLHDRAPGLLSLSETARKCAGAACARRVSDRK